MSARRAGLDELPSWSGFLQACGMRLRRRGRGVTPPLCLRSLDAAGLRDLERLLLGDVVDRYSWWRDVRAARRRLRRRQ